MGKVISFSTACRLSKKFRKQGKKVLFTSGCFDIFHIGHVRFLELVRKWGGKNAVIMVGVDTDQYLSHYKGEDRPIFKQEFRAEILSHLDVVDYVIVFQRIPKNEKQFVLRFKLLDPYVIVYGNTERLILERIKRQVAKAGYKFKHLPHKTKLESSSRIGKLILNHPPS